MKHFTDNKIQFLTQINGNIVYEELEIKKVSDFPYSGVEDREIFKIKIEQWKIISKSKVRKEKCRKKPKRALTCSTNSNMKVNRTALETG